jgi:RNA polymerase sigma factor (sigma-70 family)
LPLTPAETRRNNLVESNLALVDRIAKHVMLSLPPCFDFEDLRQAGCIGLLAAATRFRAKFRVPFPQYAKKRIRGEMVESVRRRHWKNATHLPMDDKVIEMPAVGVASPEAVVRRIEHADRARVVAQAAEGLTTRSAKVIEIYFNRDAKLAGIGAAFGVKQSRASQLLQIAKREIARELSYRGVRKAA